MKFLVLLVFLLGITGNKFTSGEDVNITSVVKNDVKDLNTTCKDTSHDSCAQARVDDSLEKYPCQCTAVCSRLGTCCADSPYVAVKSPAIRPICRSLDNERSYFMVDRCFAADTEDSVWAKLCHAEWNYEDNVLQLVPITSLFTHVTYKNYFCFRCHENTDDFMFWNLKLENNDYPYDHSPNESKIFVHYDPYNMTWVAPLGTEGSLIPVNVTSDVPTEVGPIPVVCEPDVISFCPDTWSDKNVSDKCAAYMRIVSVLKNGISLKYRNEHCAVCNFEDLSNIQVCEEPVFATKKVRFSFTHLLDINRSDGDKVGKIQRCEDNFLWDPYAEKCRKLACALPGYVIKNGKCIPP